LIDCLNDNCDLIKELKFLFQPTCNIVSPNHLIIDLRLKDFISLRSPLIGEVRDRKVNGGGFFDDSSFVDMNSFVVMHSEFDCTININ